MDTIEPLIPEMFSDKISLTEDERQTKISWLQSYKPDPTLVTSVPIIDAGMLTFAGEQEYERLQSAMIAIGMITAFNNKYPFKNKLIRTRTKYEFTDLYHDMGSVVEQIIRESYMMKTDVIDGLRCILNQAITHESTVVPDQLIIISDGPASHIISAINDDNDGEMTKLLAEYDDVNLRIPQVVFWYFRNYPGEIESLRNIIYVDGYSPQNMMSVLNGTYGVT